MKTAAVANAIKAMGMITPIATLDAVSSPFEEGTAAGDVEVDETDVVDVARELVAPDEMDDVAMTEELVSFTEIGGKEETSPPEMGIRSDGATVTPPPLQLPKPRKSTNFWFAVGRYDEGSIETGTATE